MTNTSKNNILTLTSYSKRKRVVAKPAMADDLKKWEELRKREKN